MNPLDIMLLGAITLFALFGKYSGFYPQLNKFISLIISILITNKNIPIIKTTGYDLGVRMREYVVLHVLRHHRNLSTVIEARNNNEWKQIIESAGRPKILDDSDQTREN